MLPVNSSSRPFSMVHLAAVVARHLDFWLVFALVLALCPELVQRCSRVAWEPVVEQLLQQGTLPSCCPWPVLVQQSPPCDSTLNVTRVFKQLPCTFLAHHDQHLVQLSAESSRVRVHVDIAHCCHVPGFAQNEQLVQTTVDGSKESYELELQRPPTRLSPIERHWFAK